MSRKTLIWLGLGVGSTVGGILPSLWGAGMFSFSAVVLSAVGGLAGIWAGLKLSQKF
jgi:hypothetical protein